ncbi:hypothetical protein EGW08_023642 [Elysia chlorotica]|uniref:C2H2-type domain-containing protein n=1 Tax=Elysia chlorotica TaxID=188477 RepID=A0A3S1AVR2_ELYCH|nr:hypothetical protein EGW08_023642 [Elysia chlorotica]
MNKHKEAIWFYFEVCGQGLVFLGKLNNHLKMHGERKFQCEKCGIVFFNSKALERHQLIHEPSPCETCGKMLSSLEGYKSHFLAHKGPPRFNCDLCNKGYYTAWNLSNHKKAKHKTV